MSTANGLLWENGMDMSWVDVGGIKYWSGAWVCRGFQVSSKIRAFPRSATSAAIVIQSTGPFAPPKSILSDMRTYNAPFQFI